MAPTRFLGHFFAYTLPHMTTLLRRLRGLLGVGLSWAILWGLVIFAIGTVISIVDPGSIDAGEEPWRMVLTIVAPIGFISGITFGTVLMATERKKTIRDLSLWRVALSGAVAGGLLPALGLIDAPLENTIPLGAIASTLTVALARRGAARTPDQAGREPMAESREPMAVGRKL